MDMEIVQAVAEVSDNVLKGLLQLGSDLGIPFDCIPDTKGEIAYFQGCIQWVIFSVTLCIGELNSFIRFSMGSMK